MTFNDIFKNGFLQSYANTEITFSYAVASMLICTVFASVICVVYYYKARKYYFSREFAAALVTLAVITCSVILTIQSSIVVSLGMVGALSIVRFRTAIKNPLDLVFLFWSISVGIICGAGLYYIAIALILIVGIAVLISDDIPGLPSNQILVLDGVYPYDVGKLTDSLKKHSKYWNVRSESVRNREVNMIVEIRGLRDGAEMIREILEAGDFRNVSILQQEGTVE